jgi:hypothetical protein
MGTAHHLNDNLSQYLKQLNLHHQLCVKKIPDFSKKSGIFDLSLLFKPLRQQQLDRECLPMELEIRPLLQTPAEASTT